MSQQKLKPYLTLFLFACLVRLFFLYESTFLADEAKFFAVIRDIVEGYYFPRLGPPITIPGTYIPGGLFFYLLSFSQFLGSSVVNVSLFMIFLNSISIVLFFDFVRMKWNQKAAWVSALFLCLSPWMIFYNITIWNPNLIYFFLAATLWLGARLEKKWRSKEAVLVLVLLGLYPQIHLSAIGFWFGFAFFLAPVFCAHKKEIKPVFKWTGFILFLFYLPYLTLEIKMRFANTLAIVFGSTGGVVQNSFSFLFLPLYLLRFLTGDLSYFQLAGFDTPLNETLALKTYFLNENGLNFSAIISSLFAFIVLLFGIQKGEKSKDRFRFVVYLFLGVHLLLLFISKKQVFPHYFNGLIIICALLIGWCFTDIKKNTTKVVFLFFFFYILGSGLLRGVLVSREVFSPESFGLKNQVIQKIKEKFNPQNKKLEIGVWKLKPDTSSLNVLANRLFFLPLEFYYKQKKGVNLLFLTDQEMKENPLTLKEFKVLETLTSNTSTTVFLVEIRDSH